MKTALVGIALAGTLALTGCGSSRGYESNDLDWGGYNPNGYSSSDWDLNNGSVYNNNTYCGGGIYNPLPNNQYSCNRNGVTSTPAARPPVVVPPKSAQKPPSDFKPVPKTQTQPKAPSQQKAPSAPKPAAPAPKAPAPAPKAPAPAPRSK